MSWSGTVTCSHCYRQGHNKRKCPTLTQDYLDKFESFRRIAASAAESGDQDLAQHYESKAEHFRKMYMKRTKVDPATGEKVTNKAAKAERMKNVTCGYCGERGHTRRVCEVVKRDKLVFAERSKQARAAALEAARETGIGVGSMIPTRVNGWHGPKGEEEYGYHVSLRYVKDVDWNAVTSSRPHLYVFHADAKRLATGGGRSRDRLVRMLENYEDARGHAEASGDRPPSASLMPNLDVPDGWLECSAETIDFTREFPTKGSKYDKQRKSCYAWPSAETSEVIRTLGLAEHWLGRLDAGS